MTSFVVFRIGKLKSWGEIAAAGSHNHRTRPTPNAGDSSRNVVIKSPPAGVSIVDAVRAKIGSQKIRKNAVLAVEAIVSASPEYFRPSNPAAAGTWDESRLKAWRENVEPWIAKEFPHAVSVVLHLDESTPHYQIIDVPLDERGKLNARAKYGGAQTLRRWQDRAADAVKSLAINRGIPGSAAKHEKVKRFYAAAAAQLPALPIVKTPPPRPLPPPTLAERLPFTDASSARKRLEERVRAQSQQRAREQQSRARALELALEPALAKAARHDAAVARAAALASTASRLSDDIARLRAQELRELHLPDVLQRIYGATEARDSKPSYRSRKFKLADGREIAVTDQLWVEQGGPGGRGAIDLVMHLDRLASVRSAIRLLQEYFDASDVSAAAAAAAVAAAREQVTAAMSEPVPSPEPSPPAWPRVRDWLVRVRCVPGRIVDWCHERGLVYADASANAVFKREKGGAFIRGTGETRFMRTIGGAACGAFVVPGVDDELCVVEGPVDALALRSMRRSTVLATGGSLLQPQRVLQRLRLRPGVKLFVATDADEAGERYAREMLRLRSDAVRLVPPAPAKDWGDALKIGANAVFRPSEPLSEAGQWWDSDAGSQRP